MDTDRLINISASTMDAIIKSVKLLKECGLDSDDIVITTSDTLTQVCIQGKSTTQPLRKCTISIFE